MSTIIPEPPTENLDPWFAARDAFDHAVKVRLNNELSDGVLNATFVGQDEFTGVFTWRNGPGGELTVKPLGEGSAGLWDLVQDDNRGFLFHLHTGPNSTDNTAVIGIGTDRGQGNGLLISHKNTASGIMLTQHPGSGRGMFAVGWSRATPAVDVLLRANAQPFTIRNSWDAGFDDGVTTLGSATITSATAAFTPADVGKPIAQLTSVTGTAIDTGTITAVTNATTATMSKPALLTSTGIRFSVGERVGPSYQSLFIVKDYNGDTIFNVSRNAIQTSKTVQIEGTGSNAPQIMFRTDEFRMYMYNPTAAKYNAHYWKPANNGELQLRNYVAANLGSETVSAASIRAAYQKLGFFDTAPTARPSGVAVTVGGIHAALVTLGLITA